jgi:dCTP deaminase
MILSDREIRMALRRGHIRIIPEPPARDWSSTALDLTLAPDFAVWDPPAGQGLHVQFSPGDVDFNYAELFSQYARKFVLPDAGHPLEPGKFGLGWTAERIQLPHQSRIAARVEGKSSLARLGIGVHVTAPTIHAGFGYNEQDPSWTGSPIQLEIWNVSNLTILLKPGMRICQLIFEEVHGTPERGYEGMFAVQGP